MHFHLYQTSIFFYESPLSVQPIHINDWLKFPLLESETVKSYLPLYSYML